MSHIDHAFWRHHCLVRERIELRVVAAGDRAERIAHLTARVEAVIRKLADLERRRRIESRETRQSRAGAFPAPAAAAGLEAERFRRAPEVLLAAIALVALWFLPIDLLSDLSPDMTLATVAAIPCVLVIFVFGGAALWRAFREL